MKSKYEEYTMAQRIEDLKNIVDIQNSKGNYDASEYMLGMANGLLLAWNIIAQPYGMDVPFNVLPKDRQEDAQPV